MSSFITPNGKGVSTFICPTTAHVRIKFDQGGELPAELSGIFTSVRFADQAIISYLEKQTKEEKPKADRPSKEG